MKRFLLFALLVTLSVPIVGQSEALAQEIGIELSDVRNRDFNGDFYDQSLESKLLPGGRLAQLLNRNSSTWYIDPMLIEEIEDLANGYRLTTGEEFNPSEAAAAWLFSLTQSIAGDRVFAINYGSPSIAWLRSAAPSELRIHQALSRQRLAELLSREIGVNPQVLAALNASASPTKPKLPIFVTESYTENRREIRAINRYAKNSVTRTLRLVNGSLLNPEFQEERASSYARALQDELNNYKNSVRISKGRFTLTSQREKIPLTLINDFTNDIELDFEITASNSRVIPGKIERINILAGSKVSLTLPVEVLASGSSDVTITIKTSKGIVIGESVKLPLTLTVISPLTTWITTGSGVILLLAAIVQSLRRIRRSRNTRGGDDVQ